MGHKLQLADFSSFFRSIHDVDPFPWQLRIVSEVADKQKWPDLVDIPTGAGKTSLLDAALFLQAFDAANSPNDRWMPRRIVMVVDRRVVVDQAEVQARLLLKRLKADGSNVVGQVGEALRALWGGGAEDDPFAVGLLRGGIVREEGWMTRPDRPAILLSTVDQVGSRLLFRGYGISSGMRPIHAGLLANDALILLDEVHLSQPFSDTLRSINCRYQQWKDSEDLPRRWQAVELSATPRSQSNNQWIFTLSSNERSSLTSPELKYRLEASKPISTQLIKVPEKKLEIAEKLFVKGCIDQVRRLLKKEHVCNLAVVVNRVNSASAIYSTLLEATDLTEGVEMVLLTGRMRDFERSQIVEILGSRLRTRRINGGVQPNRDETNKVNSKLVVVATQCIEAGADLDFDSLVTECASIDALRQRIGRVDRGGFLSKNNTPAEIVVLARSSSVSEKAVDPIYGEGLRKTWEWLTKQRSQTGGIDLGSNSWERLRSTVEESMYSPRARAPYLLPAHLDAWVQTQPIPDPDPDVALWLHGLDRTSSDVQLVWRADLTGGLLKMAPMSDGSDSDNNALRAIRDILAFCPPSSSEAVTVPIGAARAWLSGLEPGSTGEIADVEGMVSDASEKSPEGNRKLVVEWRGDDSRVIAANRVKPGSILIVPANYGGLKKSEFEGNRYWWWDAAASEVVEDIGDQVQRSIGRRFVLRLLEEVWRLPPDNHIPTPADLETSDERCSDLVWEWLEEFNRKNLENCVPEFREIALTLGKIGKRQVLVKSMLEDFEMENIELPNNGRSWFAIMARNQLPAGPNSNLDPNKSEVDLESETSSFTGVAEEFVHLETHLDGVGCLAREMAERCGMPEPIVSDIELAGSLHDMGKADSRFQSWMRGGTPYTTNQPLIAKSTILAQDSQSRRSALIRSKYPKGTRHELMSLALINSSTDFKKKSNDWDLVQHLVASHHGWCRPFASFALDDEPQSVEFDYKNAHLVACSNHGLEQLDSGVSDRFWRLVRRYGWFGLAWLEAILRLADHRRSEKEQNS